MLKRGVDYVLLKEHSKKDEFGNLIYNAIALKDLECAFTQEWDKENAAISVCSKCYIDPCLGLAFKEYHFYWVRSQD